MIFPNADQEVEFLTNLSRKYLQPSSSDPVVPIVAQRDEIQLLYDTLKFERFFFRVNLMSCTLEDICGVDKWLGYSHEDFSFARYLGILHPSHAIAQRLHARQLLEKLVTGTWPVRFMVHRFGSTVALKHRNGHYVLTKQVSYIFQYNKLNQVTEYLNEFTIIGPYNGEPYSSRSMDADGFNTLWNQELISNTRNQFEKEQHFSLQELRIMREYAYNQQMSSAEIASKFKIRIHTLNTYNKRILKKGNNLFRISLDNARQVALYIKTNGLI